MTIDKIIAIAGKPGLYEIVAQSKAGIIVQSLTEQKRFPITATHNVSVLKDIAIYTLEEEMPLWMVLKSIFDLEEGKETISHKESNAQLITFFNKVLPNYDEERVYPSNIKKVVQWYNLLVKTGFDFTTLKEEAEQEN